MILTIKSVEEKTGDYGDYLQVKGFDGNGKEQTKNFGDKWREKWGLLLENTTVEVKLKKTEGGKWVIDDILNPSSQMPPQVEAKTQPEGDVPKPPNRQIAVSTSSDRDKLILRQVAFKGAVEYAIHGLIPLEDVEIWADRFNEYLNK